MTAKNRIMGFTTVRPSVEDIDRSPSPEGLPVDHNYDDWFKPVPSDMSTDFGMTSFTTASSITNLGKASLIKPSKVSLEKAKARMAAWEMEDSILEDKAEVPASSSPSKHVQSVGLPSFRRASHPKDKRPPLATLPNVLNAPAISPSTPTAVVSQKTKHPSLFPLRHSAFKSPLQISTASNIPGSPLNPSSGNKHTLSGTPVTARVMQNKTHSDTDIGPSSFSTPLRSNPSSRTRPAKFLTPFKPNMRPGESGRLSLPQSLYPPSIPQKEINSTITPNPIVLQPTSRKQFFSLSECL